MDEKTILYQAVRDAEIVQIDDGNKGIYNFKKYPFGERGNFITPELLDEIITNMMKDIRKCENDIDYLVAPEPGGHTWGMMLSYQLGIPINILRMTLSKDLQYGNPVLRKTAYNHNYLYFEHFQPGDKVMIIDDVISSGSTIRGILEQLKALQVVVVGIQVILVKGQDYKQISSQYDVPISFLVSEG